MTTMLDHPTDEIRGFWRLIAWTLVVWVVLNRAIPDQFILPVGMSVRPSQALLAIVLVLLPLAIATDPRPWPRGIPAASALGLLLVVVFAPFRLSLSFDAYQAAGAERGLMLFALYTGLFLSAYWIAGWRGWGLRMLRVVVVMTTWQALLAMYEWRAGQDVVSNWRIWSMAGLAVDSIQRAANYRVSGLFRPTSTAPHPIIMSGVAAIAIILVALMFIDEERPARRRWLMASLAPLAIAMMVVDARTGFVVLLVSGFAVVALQVRRLPHFIPLALVAMLVFGAAAVMSPSAARSTLNLFWNASDDGSVTARVDRLDDLPDLVAEQPVVGRGWLTNDPLVYLFDNTYSLTLLELGVLGTVMFLTFMISSLARMISMRRHATSSESLLMFAGIVAGFALLAGGATFDALAFDQFLPTCVLLLAMGLSAADSAVRRHRAAEAAELIDAGAAPDLQR